MMSFKSLEDHSGCYVDSRLEQLETNTAVIVI